MTIDEAIAHAREVASEQKRRSGACVQNDSECDKFSTCLKCAEDHEQLAEWLEELKAYREIGTVEECRNSVLNIPKAYNKAIDDFVKAIVDRGLSSNDDKYFIILYDNYLKVIKEIAEQLKTGGKNG